ncbi:hypothetical protein ACFHWW_02990 [Ensifer sp. P24N7]|uniref:hypothetical protein n=1 Tax=Sinorhizobium sp. P24N7 TaxID=3348358 RepID=UPI0035F3D8F9
MDWKKWTKITEFREVSSVWRRFPMTAANPKLSPGNPLFLRSAHFKLGMPVCRSFKAAHLRLTHPHSGAIS